MNTRTYILGFIVSLICTIAAYVFVVDRSLSGAELVAFITLLACIQFFTQMVCFLHIGTGKASREKLLVLGFAVLVAGLIIGGSLWIMQSLSGRMMPSAEQMTEYMHAQPGL